MQSLNLGWFSHTFTQINLRRIGQCFCRQVKQQLKRLTRTPGSPFAPPPDLVGPDMQAPCATPTRVAVNAVQEVSAIDTAYDSEQLSSDQQTVFNRPSSTAVCLFQSPSNSIVDNLSVARPLSAGAALTANTSRLDAAPPQLAAAAKDSVQQLTTIKRDVVPTAAAAMATWANSTTLPRVLALTMSVVPAFTPTGVLAASCSFPSRLLRTSLFSALLLPCLPGPKPRFSRVLLLF